MPRFGASTSEVAGIGYQEDAIKLTPAKSVNPRAARFGADSPGQ